ncbi:hypothetical protein [Flavobacterium sp. ZS1P14]|uniref:hypothetical protein n=1 Tax=Flavobacterium sp. ZS1P14 TaxID=3401729 RepID=UPI003AACFD24
MLLRKCIFLLTMIFSQIVLSQKKNDEGSNPSIIVPNGDIAYIIASINVAAANNKPVEKPKARNGVLIEQIGDFNFVYTNLKANTIALQVTQEGDYNFYELIKEANVINAKVIQKGENNVTLHNALYTGYDLYIETVQQGNNLKIQSIGSNSISDNIKIIQTGTNASVIIINN